MGDTKGQYWGLDLLGKDTASLFPELDVSSITPQGSAYHLFLRRLFESKRGRASVVKQKRWARLDV
jgi:hypothetical protein